MNGYDMHVNSDLLPMLFQPYLRSAVIRYVRSQPTSGGISSENILLENSLTFLKKDIPSSLVNTLKEHRFAIFTSTVQSRKVRDSWFHYKLYFLKRDAVTENLNLIVILVSA